LTVEYRAVRREADQSVGNGDGVETARLEVPNEDVRRPHPVELLVVERHVASSLEAKSRVSPDLSQVQRRRELLHNATQRPIVKVASN